MGTRDTTKPRQQMPPAGKIKIPIRHILSIFNITIFSV